MKLTNIELVSIRPFVEPLTSNMINTNLAKTFYLGGTYLAQIRKTKLYFNKSKVNLELLINISNALPTNEDELIHIVQKAKEDINEYPTTEKIEWAYKSLAVMALIKTGIRYGLQNNTHMLLDGISYPLNYQLSDKLIAAIYTDKAINSFNKEF